MTKGIHGSQMEDLHMADQSKEFNIDEALTRLEEINNRISDKNIPLNESIKLYTEGTQLAEECKKHLEGVKKELKILNE